MLFVILYLRGWPAFPLFYRRHYLNLRLPRPSRFSGAGGGEGEQ